jgi:hypothetical protein
MIIFDTSTLLQGGKLHQMRKDLFWPGWQGQAHEGIQGHRYPTGVYRGLHGSTRVFDLKIKKTFCTLKLFSQAEGERSF